MRLRGNSKEFLMRLSRHETGRDFLPRVSYDWGTPAECYRHKPMDGNYTTLLQLQPLSFKVFFFTTYRPSHRMWQYALYALFVHRWRTRRLSMDGMAVIGSVVVISVVNLLLHLFNWCNPYSSFQLLSNPPEIEIFQKPDSTLLLIIIIISLLLVPLAFLFAFIWWIYIAFISSNSYSYLPNVKT